MVKQPIVVKQTESLIQLLELFESTTVSHVIVIDDTRKVTGVVSKSDLLRLLKYVSVETTGKSYTQKFVQNTDASYIMTSNPICLKPDDTLEYAIELLLQDKFHALPVVDSGEPVGIVTAYDIMKAYYHENG